MDKELFERARDLYLLANPKKGHLIDKESSTLSSLGYIRLRSKEGKTLFAIKKDDLFVKLEKESQSQREKDHATQTKETLKQSKQEQIDVGYGHQIKVVSGLAENHHLVLLRDKDVLVSYTGFWNIKIIQRQNLSDVVVEEIRADSKKNVAGALVTGAVLGFMTGGAGLIAGATSGNHQIILFKLISPSFGEIFCEAKNDVYKRIICSSKHYS